MNRWYEVFLSNPNQAIADLFSGRAGLGSGLRLDIPELLYQEFPDMPEFAEPRKLLDNALLHWLNAMRGDYAAQVKRLGYGVYSKRLCDALTSVQLLDLPITIYHLRETASSWLNWLAPLRLAPERDPALEYWRVLTHRQREDACPATWLQLADDPRHEYLSVALVGLQRLPNGHDAQRNKQTQLLALLHHAVLLHDSGKASKFFNQHYATLSARYPAGPEHWQMLLETVTEGFKAKTVIGKDLLEHLRQSAKQQRKNRPSPPAALQPADKAEFDALSKDIKSSRLSASNLAQRLFVILDKNYDYSQTTGDSYFFTSTLSNLGSRLLKRRKLSSEDLERFQSMIERGLSLEPMDSFIWMLWAEYLDHSGQCEAQEWVLRETARLFPDHEASRVELARLLIRQGEVKYPEAERWLREAAERNPDREPSRVELARLLIRQGEAKYPEAERWLLEVADRHPDNEQSRVELARLLIRQGEAKYPEAERWLREAVERKSNDAPSRVELARLLIRQGEAKYPEAERWLREVADRHPDNEQSRVVLAKLLFKQNKTPEAENLLTEFLKDYPKNSAKNILTQIKDNTLDVSAWLDVEADDSEIIGEPQIGCSHQLLNENSASADRSCSDTLVELLAELQRRAKLQAAFAQAPDSPDSMASLVKEAEQGDALALFYREWLQPGEVLVPPHAWAAQACRLYKKQALETDWQQLSQDFPEHYWANRYLLAITVDRKIDALQRKLSDDKEGLTPLQQFIYRDLESGDSTDRDKQVMAVLANGAVGAPQIVRC
ncbi:tetratricopeptide repeat protein [Methylobacter tundripaludum]|uniref:Sel1 domain protein repeat-containing protein n=1 Tax=Methylobacter tundripaludum (strain ATCC BAA-1195 / DSM 17260 / SV96) TaxID=697282 RepID=G3J1K7_METTV|nr:tetratricopeptide repeat protein [Methylobacter tundripaludum]EGW19951.1 Sel1 domain protein repeat-containing protein [Methylobacter tundripaludum SV96]